MLQRAAEYKKGPDANEGQHRREDELMKLRGKAKAAALSKRRAQVPVVDVAAPHSLRNKAASVLTAPIQSLESSAALATHAQDSNDTPTSASSLPDAGFCFHFSNIPIELLNDEDTIVIENVNRDIVEPVLMPKLSALPSNSWGNAFGPIPEGGWHCQSCHIHNAKIAQQCASCATSRVV